jgi:hypothetical protein
VTGWQGSLPPSPHWMMLTPVTHVQMWANLVFVLFSALCTLPHAVARGTHTLEPSPTGRANFARILQDSTQTKRHGIQRVNPCSRFGAKAVVTACSGVHAADSDSIVMRFGLNYAAMTQSYGRPPTRRTRRNRFAVSLPGRPNRFAVSGKRFAVSEASPACPIRGH